MSSFKGRSTRVWKWPDLAAAPPTRGEVDPVPLAVAIVTEYYYPLLGGITENIHHTALRLRERGHSVTIITSNVTPDGLPDREIVPPAAEVIRIGTSIRLPGNGSTAR